MADEHDAGAAHDRQHRRPVELSESRLASFFATVLPHLDERQRRLVAAAMAASIGRGGQAAVARSSGLARNTIAGGAGELADRAPPRLRVRRAGGGRKRAVDLDPGLVSALESLLDPASGGPSVLRWSVKSARQLSTEVEGLGHRAGPSVVRRTLSSLGYSSPTPGPAAQVVPPGTRWRQFDALAALAEQHRATGQPIVTVSCRQRVSTGAGAAAAPPTLDLSTWGPAEHADTSAFAAATIARWWSRLGRARFPTAARLMVVADARSAVLQLPAFEELLAPLAVGWGVALTVGHLPSGICRWVHVEPQMRSFLDVDAPTGPPATSLCAIAVVARVGDYGGHPDPGWREPRN